MYLIIMIKFQHTLTWAAMKSTYAAWWVVRTLAGGERLRAWTINGINLGTFVGAKFGYLEIIKWNYCTNTIFKLCGYSWNNKTTIMGHSVSTLNEAVLAINVVGLDVSDIYCRSFSNKYYE